MDIKVINRTRPKIGLEIRPKIGPENKPDPGEKKFKKILIIACPIAILAFVFIMVKIFILAPLSSKEKLFPGQDSKTDITIDKNALSAGLNNQPANAAPRASSNAAAPSANSNPAPQTPPQPDTNTATTENNTDTNANTSTETDATTANPSLSDKFISGSPIKVSEIIKISKFRSCADVAFGDTSFEDQKESESSLLHYFNLKDSSVSISAPFNGEIIHTSSDSLVIEFRPFDGWLMEISGFNPKNNLTDGTQVKTGDEIGKSSGDNIKIALSGFTKSQKEEKYKNYSGQNLDSFFSHLNSSVSTEFSDKGATASSMLFSKSDRDSKECVFKPDNEEDWITLK